MLPFVSGLKVLGRRYHHKQQGRDILITGSGNCASHPDFQQPRNSCRMYACVCALFRETSVPADTFLQRVCVTSSCENEITQCSAAELMVNVLFAWIWLGHRAGTETTAAASLPSPNKRSVTSENGVTSGCSRIQTVSHSSWIDCFLNLNSANRIKAGFSEMWLRSEHKCACESG